MIGKKNEDFTQEDSSKLESIELHEEAKNTPSDSSMSNGKVLELSDLGIDNKNMPYKTPDEKNYDTDIKKEFDIEDERKKSEFFHDISLGINSSIEANKAEDTQSHIQKTFKNSSKNSFSSKDDSSKKIIQSEDKSPRLTQKKEDQGASNDKKVIISHNSTSPRTVTEDHVEFTDIDLRDLDEEAATTVEIQSLDNSELEHVNAEGIEALDDSSKDQDELLDTEHTALDEDNTVLDEIPTLETDELEHMDVVEIESLDDSQDELLEIDHTALEEDNTVLDEIPTLETDELEHMDVVEIESLDDSQDELLEIDHTALEEDNTVLDEIPTLETDELEHMDAVEIESLDDSQDELLEIDHTALEEDNTVLDEIPTLETDELEHMDAVEIESLDDSQDELLEIDHTALEEDNTVLDEIPSLDSSELDSVADFDLSTDEASSISDQQEAIDQEDGADLRDSTADLEDDTIFDEVPALDSDELSAIVDTHDDSSQNITDETMFLAEEDLADIKETVLSETPALDSSELDSVADFDLSTDEASSISDQQEAIDQEDSAGLRDSTADLEDDTIFDEVPALDSDELSAIVDTHDDSSQNITDETMFLAEEDLADIKETVLSETPALDSSELDSVADFDLSTDEASSISDQQEAIDQEDGADLRDSTADLEDDTIFDEVPALDSDELSAIVDTHDDSSQNITDETMFLAEEDLADIKETVLSETPALDSSELDSVADFDLSTDEASSISDQQEAIDQEDSAGLRDSTAGLEDDTIFDEVPALDSDELSAIVDTHDDSSQNITDETIFLAEEDLADIKETVLSETPALDSSELDSIVDLEPDISDESVALAQEDMPDIIDTAREDESGLSEVHPALENYDIDTIENLESDLVFETQDLDTSEDTPTLQTDEHVHIASEKGHKDKELEDNDLNIDTLPKDESNVAKLIEDFELSIEEKYKKYNEEVIKNKIKEKENKKLLKSEQHKIELSIVDQALEDIDKYIDKPQKTEGNIEATKIDTSAANISDNISDGKILEAQEDYSDLNEFEAKEVPSEKYLDETPSLESADIEDFASDNIIATKNIEQLEVSETEYEKSYLEESPSLDTIEVYEIEKDLDVEISSEKEASDLDLNMDETQYKSDVEANIKDWDIEKTTLEQEKAEMFTPEEVYSPNVFDSTVDTHTFQKDDKTPSSISSVQNNESVKRSDSKSTKYSNMTQMPKEDFISRYKSNMAKGISLEQTLEKTKEKIHESIKEKDGDTEQQEQGADSSYDTHEKILSSNIEEKEFNTEYQDSYGMASIDIELDEERDEDQSFVSDEETLQDSFDASLEALEITEASPSQDIILDEEVITTEEALQDRVEIDIVEEDLKVQKGEELILDEAPDMIASHTKKTNEVLDIKEFSPLDEEDFAEIELSDTRGKDRILIEEEIFIEEAPVLKSDALDTEEPSHATQNEEMLIQSSELSIEGDSEDIPKSEKISEEQESELVEVSDTAHTISISEVREANLNGAYKILTQPNPSEKSKSSSPAINAVEEYVEIEDIEQLNNKLNQSTLDLYTRSLKVDYSLSLLQLKLKKLVRHTKRARKAIELLVR